MGKKKTHVDPVQSTNGATEHQGETTAAYFRRIIRENPGLLKERSNEKLLQRWSADHAGHAEVPQKIKNNLSNIKSVLRSKKRKRVAARCGEAQPAGQLSQPGQPATHVARKPTGSTKLEGLEYQIDECLILAKRLDRDGLERVIGHLRLARNEVVWKLGQ